jgi:DNA primase
MKSLYDRDTIKQVNSINIIEYAKQYLDLKFKHGEYWATCPFHNDDATPSLSFNQEKNVFNCLACGCGGSIIQFVQSYHKVSFPKAMDQLIKYAKLTVIPRKHSEILDFLHKTKRKNKVAKIISRKYLPDNYMDRYSKKQILEWINEGISKEVLDKFQVKYDIKGNRIVFPIRNQEGKIISIKGRTLYDNYADLGVSKYIYYHKIITNDFLFGLYENKNSILEKKECVIVEAEKGVMKLSSWGFDNAVALSSSNITNDQAHLLLNLKCNLIFAFDKDILRKDVIDKIRGLSLFTNVFYLYDINNLLEGKESPYDKGIDTWNTLCAKYKYKL